MNINVHDRVDAKLRKRFDDQVRLAYTLNNST